MAITSIDRSSPQIVARQDTDLNLQSQTRIQTHPVKREARRSSANPNRSDLNRLVAITSIPSRISEVICGSKQGVSPAECSANLNRGVKQFESDTNMYWNAFGRTLAKIEDKLIHTQGALSEIDKNKLVSRFEQLKNHAKAMRSQSSTPAVQEAYDKTALILKDESKKIAQYNTTLEILTQVIAPTQNKINEINQELKKLHPSLLAECHNIGLFDPFELFHLGALATTAI